MDKTQLTAWLEVGGRRIGLGDWRAEKQGGVFGRFDVARSWLRRRSWVRTSASSRALALSSSLDQTLESFLRGHVEAFDALGGIARTLVYDNLRSAVLDRRGAAVQFHPRLLELAGHYHFAPLRPLRPQSLLGPPHPRPQAPDPARQRHPRPHPRPADRARPPSPHLRHRTDRRGPRAPGGPARRHPRAAVPASAALFERLAERGEALRPHATRLLALLDDYGPQELAAAVDDALQRDALGAGSITHILETRRRQRGLKPPLRLTLPDRPGLRDLDVRPHDLETYDAIGRNTPDDAAD